MSERVNKIINEDEVIWNTISFWVHKDFFFVRKRICMTFTCDQCQKEFNTQAGLDQHKADKHGMSRHEKKEVRKQEHQEQRHVGKSSSKKIVMYVVAAVIIIAAVGAAYYFVSSNPGGGGNNNNNILNTNLYSHNALALHIHPHLEIEINGQKQAIPQGIGVSSNVMRVIHTHDDTGKLHVESPVPHTFKLQDFFTVWEKTFSDSCIFEYCNNETHQLRMTVNSQPSSAYGELPLKDLDNIRIVYGPKA